MHLVSSDTAEMRLDYLLRPRSIALVGASAKPGSLGHSVLLNLRAAGYRGDLHLVNPKRPLIEDKPCISSIGELPSGIDCAVLAIPGSAVLEAANACANRGVRSLIVFAAGFAERGEAGRGSQRELKRIAQDHDMIIVGPNCLGMINYVDSIPLTFVVSPSQARGKRPGVAIVSQSGALAAVIAVNMRHHGITLTYAISTGNEASHGVEDFLEYFIDDAETRVLAIVVEQFRKPREFLDLTRRAREKGKFIVLLHPGISDRARASAATHTGAMTGDYEVMRTLVGHAGVMQADSLEELVDISQILFHIRELPRKGAAIFTESGAFKALTLDLCERLGLELPGLSTAAERALKDALPEFIPPSNPLDLTAQGLVDPTLYRRTLPAFLDDRQFGSVVLAIILTDPTTIALKLPPILDAIRALKPQMPLIFAALDEGAPFDCQGVRELRGLGVPCFPSPERALRALARVTSRGRRLFALASDTQARSAPAIAPGMLPEYRAKKLLNEFGIPVPQGELAESLDEAIRIAHSLGFPIALKAQAVGLPHKSDAGGVILSIESDCALVEAWAALHESLKARRTGLVLEGVLVERMVKKGAELIFGARNDRDWGPVLLAGFGGVLAEVAHDVRLMPPDSSIEQIEQELATLRFSALFRGFRGSPPLDIEAAARILFALAETIRCHPEIEEIDVNPVVVYARGEGAVALDALIVVGRNDSVPA